VNEDLAAEPNSKKAKKPKELDTKIVLYYERLLSENKKFVLTPAQRDIISEKHFYFARIIDQQFMGKSTNLSEIDAMLKTQFPNDDKARIDCIAVLGTTIGMSSDKMVLLMQQIQKPSQPTAPGRGQSSQ